MDFSILSKSIKKSVEIFMRSPINFIAAAIITIIGSITVILAPPLNYGLIYMATKASRGDNPEIGDVFFALRSLNRFIRSWIYYLVLALITFLTAIVLTVIGFFSMYIMSKSSIWGLIAYLIIFILTILVFLVFTALFYGETIYVLDPSKSAIDAMKMSFVIAKENIVLTILAILITIILNIIGSMFLGILVLVTLPICTIFTIYVVKNLEPAVKDLADNID